MLVFVAGSLLAADAQSELSKAVAKLGDQPNYSWTTTMKMPDDSRMQMGPTEGKTEKGGYTYTSSAFGDRKMERIAKGDKVAFTRQGEWQSADDSAGQGRGMMRGLRTPAEQATDLLKYVTDVKKEGEVYTGKISEQGVKSMITFRRRGGEEPEVRDPSGTAKFWVKDGMLSKYEFQIKGGMTFNNNDIQMDRTTTVEIKDVGKTKVEVPAEAKEKLS
jgi:hypothetical protein